MRRANIIDVTIEMVKIIDKGEPDYDEAVKKAIEKINKEKENVSAKVKKCDIMLVVKK